MKISRKLILVLGIIAVVISVPSTIFLTGNIRNPKSVAYKRTKKLLKPDLYLIYRITDRILEANNFRKMFNIILGGGEDYQLLFSAKGKKSENLQGTRIYHKIGYFRRGKGVKVMKNKSEIFLQKVESFSHF